jgi:membrane-bound serine protease (ClpP class)
VPGFGVSLTLIATFALISSALFTLVLVMALNARRRPVVSGREQLVGAFAEATQDFDREGYVHVRGENWFAVTATPVKRGEHLKVTKMDGLTLSVEPIQASQKENTS